MNELQEIKDNVNHLALINELLTKPISPRDHAAKKEILQLRKELDNLAKFLTSNFAGQIQEGSAVENAIRILRDTLPAKEAAKPAKKKGAK